MSTSESLFDNKEIEAELPSEAIQWSNAIKTISSIKPKEKQMYIYKPVITYDRFTVNEIKNITSPNDLLELFRSQLLGPTEKVGCLFLSPRNDIIERFVFAVMTNGTVDQSAVYPREIFKMAILNHATRLILCHNHPSNHAGPSLADYSITKVLKDGAKLIGIDLLDHIIITEDSYYSFQEQGEL
jgi:DNA repair protein RadC